MKRLLGGHNIWSGSGIISTRAGLIGPIKCKLCLRAQRSVEELEGTDGFDSVAFSSSWLSALRVLGMSMGRCMCMPVHVHWPPQALSCSCGMPTQQMPSTKVFRQGCRPEVQCLAIETPQHMWLLLAGLPLELWDGNAEATEMATAPSWVDCSFPVPHLWVSLHLQRRCLLPCG